MMETIVIQSSLIISLINNQRLPYFHRNPFLFFMNMNMSVVNHSLSTALFFSLDWNWDSFNHWYSSDYWSWNSYPSHSFYSSNNWSLNMVSFSLLNYILYYRLIHYSIAWNLGNLSSYSVSYYRSLNNCLSVNNLSRLLN